MKLARLGSFAALAVIAADWFAKGFLPHGSQHFTSGNPLQLFAAMALLAIVVGLIGSATAALAAGAWFGGVCGNVIDSAVNGYVWNMIPVPWTGGFYCNVADCGIVFGGTALLAAALTHLAGTFLDTDATNL